MRTVVGRKKTQPILLERRVPTQARAHATIEAIFEATARIIERDGVAALNTNVIAERAGLSIGTLYEYFPKKRCSSRWQGAASLKMSASYDRHYTTRSMIQRHR
jgi:AcrR family transcriptional regulator